MRWNAAITIEYTKDVLYSRKEIHRCTVVTTRINQKRVPKKTVIQQDEIDRELLVCVVPTKVFASFEEGTLIDS